MSGPGSWRRRSTSYELREDFILRRSWPVSKNVCNHMLSDTRCVHISWHLHIWSRPILLRELGCVHRDKIGIHAGRSFVYSKA
jgi:hypothetical protein